jgi:16S rRNA (guanine527-N7)-methyltransferase
VKAALRVILVDGAARMGIELSAEAVDRFATLLSLLQVWGRKINLTTRLEEEEVVVHHFLDSLAGAPFLSAEPEARIIDLGAGAGFPSFPLKFALPRLRITMIESVRKKVSFCREVIRATGSTDIEAVCARGEELGREQRHRGAYDWAVSRALGSSADVLRLAQPFMSHGGHVMVYKGSPERGELEDLSAACGEMGATWRIHGVDVPHLQARRSLIVVSLAGG